MWPPTITECECSSPGFCERHQCVKGYWQHRLCRRVPSVFDTYERGEGPEQIMARIVDERETEAAGPGLIRRGVNFVQAGARHVSNGMRRVSDETYESRLAVCGSCEFCDKQRMVCLKPQCGCFLKTKARWASEACPLDKWRAEVPLTTDQPP